MNRLSLISHQISSQTPITLSTLQKIKLSVQPTLSIGILTLNSPKELNSLSQTVLDQILFALKYFSSNDQVKAIIINSSHQKIFCAGADIKRFLKQDYEFYIKNQIFTTLQAGFKQCKKPIIAAVNGKALGGGFEIALLCDIVIASENAYFALPEVNLGLMPGIGGTQRLAKLIGEKLAMRYILTGDGFDGRKANQMNVCELVKAEKFHENITQKATSTLMIAKRAVKFSTDSTLSQGIEFEKSTFYPMLATNAAKEGIKSFLQKRKPNFKGM